MADAELIMVARMRDEASAGLKNLGTQVKTVEGQTGITAATFKRFVPQIARVGTAALGLGVAFGLIGNQIGGTVGKVFMFTGAIASALPALSALVGMLKNVAIVQSVVAALFGRPWVGIAALAVGATVAAGLGGLALGKRGAAAAPAVGEMALAGVPTTIAGAGGGGNVTINVGALMGDESDAREFARLIQKYNRENTRLGQ